jgi:hypothetical protein
MTLRSLKFFMADRGVIIYIITKSTVDPNVIMDFGCNYVIM